jgi:hypothetical protein
MAVHHQTPHPTNYVRTVCHTQRTLLRLLAIYRLYQFRIVFKSLFQYQNYCTLFCKILLAFHISERRYVKETVIVSFTMNVSSASYSQYCTCFPCMVLNIGLFFCEVLDILNGDHLYCTMTIFPSAVNTTLYTSEYSSCFYVPYCSVRVQPSISENTVAPFHLSNIPCRRNPPPSSYEETLFKYC